MVSRHDISVVLATRDRDSVLAGTLTHIGRTLRACDLDVEIIVVDNGSVDSTAEVLSYFEDHLPLVVLSEPEPGKNRALNRALAVADGALIVFTDDDVIPSDRWLQHLFEATDRWPDHDVFGGRIIPRYPPGREPPFTDPDFTSFAYSFWAPEGGEGPTEELPFGPNFAVRASSMESITLNERIGPGATGMGSETTLLKDLIARGSRIVYIPDATVHHVVSPYQLEPGYLVRRSFRLGVGTAWWSRDESSRRILNVPRHLWRSLVESWITAHLPFADDLRKLRARLDLEFVRGQIHAYRRGE